MEAREQGVYRDQSFFAENLVAQGVDEDVDLDEDSD